MANGKEVAMEQLNRIEWAEFRESRGFWELFFMIAEEVPGGWHFSESSTWENRWYSIASTPAHVAIAEHGKKGFADGTVTAGTVAYLLAVKQETCCKWEVREELDPDFLKRRSQRNRRIAMRLSYRRRGQGATDAGPTA
jgi:hypothetical protein